MKKIKKSTTGRLEGGHKMLTDNFVTMEIGKAKHIALVAHDGKKKELI